MSFERFKGRTRIQVSGKPSSNQYDAAAAGWDDMAGQFDQMFRSFYKTAYDNAQTEGEKGGRNAVKIDDKGEITLATVPDRGTAYMESYMAARRIGYAAALRNSLQNKSVEIAGIIANNPDAGLSLIDGKSLMEQLLRIMKDLQALIL